MAFSKRSLSLLDRFFPASEGQYLVTRGMNDASLPEEERIQHIQRGRELQREPADLRRNLAQTALTTGKAVGGIGAGLYGAGMGLEALMGKNMRVARQASNQSVAETLHRGLSGGTGVVDPAVAAAVDNAVGRLTGGSFYTRPSVANRARREDVLSLFAGWDTLSPPEREAILQTQQVHPDVARVLLKKDAAGLATELEKAGRIFPDAGVLPLSDIENIMRGPLRPLTGGAATQEARVAKALFLALPEYEAAGQVLGGHGGVTAATLNALDVSQRKSTPLLAAEIMSRPVERAMAWLSTPTVGKGVPLRLAQAGERMAGLPGALVGSLAGQGYQHMLSRGMLMAGAAGLLGAGAGALYRKHKLDNANPLQSPAEIAAQIREADKARYVAQASAQVDHPYLLSVRGAAKDLDPGKLGPYTQQLITDMRFADQI